MGTIILEEADGKQDVVDTKDILGWLQNAEAVRRNGTRYYRRGNHDGVKLFAAGRTVFLRDGAPVDEA